MTCLQSAVRASSGCERSHTVAILMTVAATAMAAIFLASGRALAQAANEQGFKPFGSYQGSSIDQVNVQNGHLQLRVPLVAYPQRGGKLKLSFALLYHNSVWNQTKDCATTTNICFNNWQWDRQPGVNMVFEQGMPFITQQLIETAPNCPGGSNCSEYAYVLNEVDESAHMLGNLSGSLFESLDATGIRVDNTAGAVTFSDGTRYTNLYTSNPLIEDVNGNQIHITEASSGTTITDTVGRSIPYAGASTTDFTGCTGPLPIVSATVWSVPGPNNLVSTYKFCMANVKIFTNHWAGKTGTPTQHYIEPNGNYPMLQSVVRPDNTSWIFTYSQPDANGVNWGDLVKVTTPTGGSISYVWSHPTGCNTAFGTPGPVSGAIIQRAADANDGQGPQSWTYSNSGSGATFNATVTDPTLNDTVHVFTDLSGCAIYETQTQYYSGTGTSRSLLKTVTTDYSFEPNTNYPSVSFTGGDPNRGLAPAFNVVAIRSTTAFPNGQSTKSEMAYDNQSFSFLNPFGQASSTPGIYGKQTALRVFDYYQGTPPSTPLKTTSTAYAWQSTGGAAYITYNVLDVPTSVSVLDAQGNGSLTAYSYDETTPAASGVTIEHDTAPANGNVRGNLTSTQRWENGNVLSTPACAVSGVNFFLVQTKSYLDTGMVGQSRDACGHSTSYQYATGTPYAGAYTTQTCDALNHCITTNYDANTGLPADVTDANGNKTSYAYDNFGRLTNINYPDGGQTQGFYPDPNTVEVRQLENATTSTSIDRYTYFDGFLRQKQTRLVDPEGDVFSETTYDPLGRVATTTNPHRSVAAATDGKTVKQYDALGRVIQVKEPDGNTMFPQYLDPGVIILTDETGRQRREFTDALGRLIEVDEPSNTGLAQPYSTFYSYDILNNLSRVEQHGNTSDATQWRVRTFVYDSMSRLMQSNNPETGQINYGYDADGNVVSRQDARGVTVSYSYDKIHRPQQKSFTDGTPTESLFYDQTSVSGLSVSNPIGRLTSTTAAGGVVESVLSYDPMGRVASESICLPSNCGSGFYGASALYDLAGHLTALTYPSGRTVSTTYSSAGRPVNSVFSALSGQSTNYSYYTVAQATTPGAWGYNPNGSMHLGTFGNGVQESYGYNNRSQLNSISASGLGQTWMAKNYGFYDANGNDNGTILNIIDSLNAGRSQFYTYDSLSRVSSGYQQDGSFNQTFNYDPWANMTMSGTNNFNPFYDGNNRIAGPGPGCAAAIAYCYDSAGNMLNDAFHQYAYDGDSRIKSVDGTGAGYTYGAGGQRVRKNAGGTATEYIYFQGSPIAERDVASGSWSDYIFFDGRRIAKSDQNDIYIQTAGTVCTNCGWQFEEFHFALPPTHPLYHYTIQNGDKFFVRQHETTGTRAGIGLGFIDGTYTGGDLVDQDGNPAADDTVTVGWHYRRIDLSAYAGKSIGDVFLVTDGSTAAGAWSASYDDIAVVGAEGTVRPIYTRETSVSLTAAGTSGETGVSSKITVGTATPTDAASRSYYYHADQIGSARLMTSGGGWPVWQGTFTPFGQEVSPQITSNHYKFTGKERGEASEGGLDYFGARYYSSIMGRWMTPDWSSTASPVPYATLADPQSLNLYSYVTNDPLSKTDLDGHFESTIGDGRCSANSAKCKNPPPCGGNTIDCTKTETIKAEPYVMYFTTGRGRNKHVSILIVTPEAVTTTVYGDDGSVVSQTTQYFALIQSVDAETQQPYGDPGTFAISHPEPGPPAVGWDTGLAGDRVKALGERIGCISDLAGCTVTVVLGSIGDKLNEHGVQNGDVTFHFNWNKFWSINPGYVNNQGKWIECPGGCSGYDKNGNQIYDYWGDPVGRR